MTGVSFTHPFRSSTKETSPSNDPLSRTPPRQPSPFSTSPTTHTFPNNTDNDTLTYSNTLANSSSTRSRRKSSSASATYIRSPPLIPPLPSSSHDDVSRRRSSSAWTDTSTESDRPTALNHQDRRLSREWDAAHTVPSRFQKREGSIFGTPASRDGHVDRNRERSKGFREKVKEIAGRGRRGSAGDI